MSVLSATAQTQVEDKLVADGVVTRADLAELKKQSKDNSAPFFRLLVTTGKVSNEQLTKTIAHVSKIPYVNLLDAKIDSKVLEMLPRDIAERYMAVPLGEMQKRLVVAMLDATNVQAVDFLSNRIGRPIKVYAASEEGIRQVLQQYSAKLSENLVSAIGSMGQDIKVDTTKEDEKEAQKAAENITTIVQDSPISKALSTILEYAAKNRASDIHIEPLKDSLKIRCRIDGILREIMNLPKSTEPPLVSRIKILSNLKIDEHRVPQDGEFTVNVGGKDIDLRISVSPVIWGEQVVIRLLDKSGTSLKLEEMGYKGRSLRAIRAGLERTNGMILTSGPTGSGKSTSLYALLQEVKNEGVNIVTLEDPVEYKMDGINQIQVNADVGLTFSSGLRSILRQDPDIVMVGEIRDKETAELAVQASLTGHLVFSTLHTNSAAGILPRLLDMGVEPFLIASTVHVVIGQRLVRRIGKNTEQYQSSAAETAAIKETLGSLLPQDAAQVAEVSKDLGYETLPLAGDTAYTLTKGKDSPSAPGGYKGRMGLYEVFEVSDAIQQLILKRATSSEIQAQATEEGMVGMRQDGYLKALAGQTTVQEVNRVASADSA
ncbi:type II secretion system protein E [Candidatus Saccharibacteria bacterium]|nr:MAG: type II secretion system protein E [Candidatus Saccharibacteria bacterium]PID98894.1 MAG: type II secretion system protein E [Candidatus Saccharibacteria bacterium]